MAELSDEDVNRIAEAVVEKAVEDVGIRDIMIGSAMGKGAIPLYGRETRKEPCSCCLIEPEGPNEPYNRMCTSSGCIGTLKDREERDWCSEINIVPDGRCARARSIREAARECKEKHPDDTEAFFQCYIPAFSQATRGGNPSKEPWQMTRAEYIAQGTSRTTLPPELDHRGQVFAALRAGEPVPPEVLADYPDLRKGGNPTQLVYEARLWRKWANMDDVYRAFATEQEAYDYLTHLKYIATAGDKLTIKHLQGWDIKVLHRETIEKDGQFWAIRKPFEPIPTEPKGDNPGAKEPWQMTLEEYALEKGARPAWVKAGYGETYRSHKRAVERALSEGKPVPPEVLADYPALLKGAK